MSTAQREKFEPVTQVATEMQIPRNALEKFFLNQHNHKDG